MKCFNCNVALTQCKSKYGYYYFCASCKKTFETASQRKYNEKYRGTTEEVIF